MVANRDSAFFCVISTATFLFMGEKENEKNDFFGTLLYDSADVYTVFKS